jgi:two-component system, LytTR family, response regulator
MNENNQLKAVVVDDDAKSRKLLNLMLKKFPQINVVGEATNVEKAVDIINKQHPDSVFLDICLKNESGFDIMDKISGSTKVVFVSAYDDYALKAFEVKALDYLTKPVNYDRLALTVSRLMEKETNGNGKTEHGIKSNGNNNIEIRNNNDDFDEDDEMNDNENDSIIEEANNKSNKVLEYDDRLFITVDGISRFIKISTIVCITAEKDYSYLHLEGGKKLLVLKPMVEWEERLTSKFFVRIHRSTIVNLECIDKVEKWFNSSYRVYIQNIEEPFQMSRRYAAKLKERFK